jgi:hypothetical protein
MVSNHDEVPVMAVRFPVIVRFARARMPPEEREIPPIGTAFHDGKARFYEGILAMHA